jgi:hypothetical protein
MIKSKMKRFKIGTLIEIVDDVYKRIKVTVIVSSKSFFSYHAFINTCVKVNLLLTLAPSLDAEGRLKLLVGSHSYLN